MIESIKCIKNLGPFESFDNVKLGKTTLIYAENGRGKTMLSEVFRSLGDDDPALVAGRKRLGEDAGDPVVVLGQSDDTIVKWTADGWKSKADLPKVAVFNDAFVDANVYSGLDVTAAHRKGLNGVVLGENGAKLARSFGDAQRRATKALEETNQAAKDIIEKVPGLEDVGRYCRAQVPEDIDEQIRENERSIATAKAASAILNRSKFEALALPDLQVNEVREILGRGIPHVADRAVETAKTHLERLWDGGEAWLSEGLKHAGINGDCPYCGQDLSKSPLIHELASYFEGAYADFKNEINAFRSKFETNNSETQRRPFGERANAFARLRKEWADDGLEVDGEFAIDAEDVLTKWQSFAEGASLALARKEATPLESAYLNAETEEVLAQLNRSLKRFAKENARVVALNEKVRALQLQVGSVDFQALETERLHLHQLKRRGDTEIAGLCATYLKKRQERQHEEKRRQELDEQLKAYRQRVFEEYGESVNRYLSDFAASFRLSEIKGTSRSGGTGEFGIQVLGQKIDITGDRPAADKPWFNNTLSGGDRTSLAFAFFLASLDQRDDLHQTTVVMDDPWSSLDGARRQRTLEYIVGLTGRANQVILMSHNLALHERVIDLTPEQGFLETLKVTRRDQSSQIESLDVARAAIDEHERREEVLRRFADTGAGELLNVAREIRPHLEGYLTSRYPNDYNPRMQLRQFIARCRERIKQGDPILDNLRLQELKSLNDYSKEYMHHGAPPLDDQELAGYVKSLLEFCRG